MEVSTNSALSELAIYAMSGVLIVAIVMSGIAAFLAIRHDAETASADLGFHVVPISVIYSYKSTGRIFLLFQVVS